MEIEDSVLGKKNFEMLREPRKDLDSLKRGNCRGGSRVPTYPVSSFFLTSDWDVQPGLLWPMLNTSYSHFHPEIPELYLIYSA